MPKRKRMNTNDLGNDIEFLKSMRNLCPGGRGGLGALDAVTFTTGDGRSVTLTSETRKKIDARLKAIRDAG